MGLGGIRIKEHKSNRILNANEVSMLNQSFANNAYPTHDTVRNLTEALGVSADKVYSWFCCERAKRRKVQGLKRGELHVVIFEILQLALVKLHVCVNTVTIN